MELEIRRAQVADGVAALDVLCRSIRMLCHADHCNDAAEIEGWLANKTEAAWAAWVARSDAAVWVAVRKRSVVGVGMSRVFEAETCSRTGEVLLNYVDPLARFAGVSKAMLAAMEAWMRDQGVDVSTLETTVTAEAFYGAQGYQPISGQKGMLQKPLG